MNLDWHTIFLEISSDEGIDPHKLELNVVSVKWDPASLGKHFNYNAVLLKQNILLSDTGLLF